MTLAAYLPLTLCDYPGRIAAMVFTQGCNFRCPWCHNRHLIPRTAETSGLNPDRILAEVNDRKTRGLIDAIVVSGGEPTLHDALPSFLAQCKEAGLWIKLDTNGSRPDVVHHCLDAHLVDFIAMDIKAPWSKYAALVSVDVPINALRASVDLIANSGLPHQFRTTRVDTLLAPEDYAVIAAQIPADSPHVWQTYRTPNEH